MLKVFHDFLMDSHGELGVTDSNFWTVECHGPLFALRGMFGELQLWSKMTVDSIQFHEATSSHWGQDPET